MASTVLYKRARVLGGEHGVTHLGYPVRRGA
jgi:hypothetical protein